MSKNILKLGIVWPAFIGAAITASVLIFGAVRHAIIEDNETLVHSIAQSILPALLVNDAVQVEALMKALESYPGIEVAELISAEGAPIASYAKSDKSFDPTSTAFELASAADDPNQIHLSSPITFDSLIVANLHIAVNLWPTYMRIMTWLGVLLIVPSMAYVLVKQFRIKLRFERIADRHRGGSNGSGEDSFNLEEAIKGAMNEADISIEFQPIQRMSDAGLFGMDVVVCWRHPSGQTLHVSPSDFIGLAEKNGISLPFDDWLITSACSFAAKWQHQYGPLILTIGITANQFKDPLFAQRLRTICENAQYPHQLLELAVSEKSISANLQEAQLALQVFVKQGLSVMIDGFGLTNNAQDLLTVLPVRKVKLDARLVKRMNYDDSVIQLVQLLVDQALTRDVQVVADSIPTVNLQAKLREIGCFFGLGSYFSAPMTASAFSEYLSKRSLDVAEDASMKKPKSGYGFSVV
jgi:EAL domain-containing protein (putative c-di-GMP-specific phosphodiesterase class I)